MAIFSIVKHNDEAKLVRAGIYGATPTLIPHSTSGEGAGWHFFKWKMSWYGFLALPQTFCQRNNVKAERRKI